MYRRICLFVIALSLLVVISATSTYAWFATIKRTGKIIFIAGEVNYALTDVSTAFIDSELIIVPGQELVQNTMQISNYSIVDSELRLKILVIVDSIDGDDLTYEITPSLDNEVLGEVAPSDINANYHWDYRETTDVNHLTDSYWYLTFNDDTTTVPKLEEEGDPPVSFEILKSLYFTGDKNGISISSTNVTIKFVFQAKQTEAVSWEELGEVDFTL